MTKQECSLYEYQSRRSEQYPDISNYLYMVYEWRSDTHELFNLNKQEGVQSYIVWWLRWGHKNFKAPALYSLDSEYLKNLFDDSAITVTILRHQFKLPNIAYWIHQNSDGLQEKFPLESKANEYLLWFITEGIQEYSLRYESQFSCPLIDFLKQPAFNSQGQESAISNALLLTHHCNQDLSSTYDLDSQQGNYELLRWWFNYGKDSHSFSPSLELDESLARLGFNDSQKDVTVLGQCFKLPNIFDWIHYCRQDLQEQFPLESKANEYVLWALTTGMSEYGIQYDDQYQSVLIEYIKYDNKDQHKTGDNVIRLIHQASPGIAEFYPIESIDAWQSYLLWLYELGSDLYPFSPSLHLLDNFERYCFENSNTDIIIFDRPFKLPNVADWFYNQPEVRETFNLTGNAADYLAWFIFYRPSSKETIPKYTNDNELYSFLKQTCDGHELISNYLALIYSYRKDVAEVHSITGYKSELDFINWWLKWDKSEGTNAEEVVSIHALEKVYSELRDYIGSNFIALEESTTEDNNTSIAVIDGINIIGMPKSPIGIGEDCRLITAAIEQLDTPFNVIDIERKKIDSTEKNYKVNIFTLPAPNIAANAAKFDGAFFKDRINIASTPWELSKWPKSLYWMFDFFDEFWIHSDFVWYSIPEKYHHKLRKIHLPVEVAPTAFSTRSDFDIPEEKFVFFSSFDFSSYSERKNPYAAIKAFNIAFPCGEGHDEQHLLIKTHNGHLHQEKLQQLNEYIENNSRISTVDASLSKAGLHDLYRCCDCHVSLHRSEGFGRNIAESMLLNLPNIVTSYSGNLDFCRPDNSYLVDHALIALSPNDYIFGTGQQWAEPSVEHAAQLMINVIKDKDSPEQTRLLNNANELITNEYSIEQLTHTIEKLKLLKDSSHEPYNEI